MSTNLIGSRALRIIRYLYVTAGTAMFLLLVLVVVNSYMLTYYRVQGTSMLPTLEDRQLLFVDRLGVIQFKNQVYIPGVYSIWPNGVIAFSDNATDIAKPLQDELESGSLLLSAKWEALFANRMSVEEFKLLAAETRIFVKKAVPLRTAATKEQLMEIMMAQDFQDLTGQVIKKVVALAQDLESQLMSVLIECECRNER